MSTGTTHPATRVGELEDELRETLRRYETIFRATHDVLYDLSFITSTVVWNEALYTQFGYSEDEPAGTVEWWTSHIHPDDAMKVEQAANEFIESRGNNWSMEYRFLKADGTYADIRDRGCIIRATDGSPQRIVGSFLDISSQKQLERAKDEFSSLISHQLRTPLTVIQIYSDLLSEGTFGNMTPTQVKEIRKIHDSSVKLIELVNDILAISSVELQQLQAAPEPIDVNALLAENIVAVMPLADKKRVSLLYKPSGSVPPVRTDPRILGQVVHNLLTNAIRYSPVDTGKVIVRLSEKPDGCVISIRDNGIGIPAADKPHVFERFYRAKNAVNSEQQGTGLGLYYVQLVTSMIGGKVWFSSTEGKGTTFHIKLPT